MSGLHFDGSSSKSVEQEMSEAVNKIRTTINSVTEAAALAKGGWEGEANTAFAGAAASWEDEADRLKVALQGITTSLGSGIEAYTNMESDNTDFFKNKGTYSTLTNL